MLGYALYGLIKLGLAFASQGWQVTALLAFYGVFYAIEEAQRRAFVADLEPERRATAVSAYNFANGVLYLPASLVAGAWWSVDPRWAFGLAVALTVATIAAFLVVKPLVVKPLPEKPSGVCATSNRRPPAEPPTVAHDIDPPAP